MKFEELANELLLDLFESLDTINLFRAFYGLNSRINQLIYTRIRAYNLDFRSVSKHDFDVVCRKHLPSIIDRVISLSLSDGDETPDLLRAFLSPNLTLNQFNFLQYLSFYYIRSPETMNQILIECRSLPYLTHLNIIQCRFSLGRSMTLGWINNIWSLPKLTHCNLNYTSAIAFATLSVVSSTIKYLSIEFIKYVFDYLSHLFKYTPHLRQLCTNIQPMSRNDQPRIHVPSIVSLKLSWKGHVDSMINFLQKMLNLCYLTLYTDGLCLNGYEWENILLIHLPKIKIFRFRMNFNFPLLDNIQQQVDQLLDSFQTPFWLEKHQWFVRCDWFPTNSYGIVYTVPYAFDHFLYLNTRLSKSTGSNDRDYWSYDRVQNLQYLGGKNASINDFPVRFPKVRHLEVGLPLDDHFWSVTPSLNQLISLDIMLTENTVYSQLQKLLDQAPRLYSLKFSNWTNLKLTSLQKIKSKSIRRLHFTEVCGSCRQYLNSAECASLINSPLGIQCEVLIISIEDRTIALDIVKKMSKLRSLIVECKGGTRNNTEISITNDIFVRWLENDL